jgi:hypothetical protein
MNRLDELEMLDDEENSESEDVPETSQSVPSSSMKLESRVCFLFLYNFLIAILDIRENPGYLKCLS